MKTRICEHCKQEKHLDDFPSAGRGHKRRLCRACFSRHNYALRRGLPVKHRSRRGKALKLTGSAYPSSQVIRRRIRDTVLLVDEANGTYLLCEVMSEVKLDPRRIPFITGFYRNLKYRIVRAVEERAAVELAGD